MPWLRSNQPDPLEQRRRHLAEQERLLAERISKLTADLHGDDLAPPKPAEPPIWRLEDDHHPQQRTAELTSQRKRHLARQRQRDMVIFFACVTLLLIVFSIVLWIFYTHYQVPGA